MELFEGRIKTSDGKYKVWIYGDKVFDEGKRRYNFEQECVLIDNRRMFYLGRLYNEWVITGFDAKIANKCRSAEYKIYFKSKSIKQNGERNPRKL